MTQEEKAKLIAGACGLTEFKGPSGSYWYGEDHPSCQDGSVLWECPDYFDDLNAMHEAEKSLTDDERDITYPKYLGIYHIPTGVIYLDASEKAEAFGLAKGLWKESK